MRAPIRDILFRNGILTRVWERYFKKVDREIESLQGREHLQPFHAVSKQGESIPEPVPATQFKESAPEPVPATQFKESGPAPETVTINQIALDGEIIFSRGGGEYASDANFIWASSAGALSLDAGTTYIEAAEFNLLDGMTGKTGVDVSFVTGTAGTNGNLAQWNGDGDAVDSGVSSTDPIFTTAQASYKSSSGSAGVSATFTNGDGATVTVEDGIITSIV